MNSEYEKVEMPDNVKHLEFRNKRLNQMRDEGTLLSLPFDDHPRVILHMIPAARLESSRLGSEFALSKLSPDMGDLPPELELFRPIGSVDADIAGEMKDGEPTVYTRRRALQIQGSSTGASDEPGRESSYSYLKVFSDGTVEAVRATYYSTEKRMLPARFKADLLEAMSRYLEIQERLGAQLPIAAILTVTGIKQRAPKETISYFPEILIPSFEYRDQNKLAELMADTFDRIPRNVIDRPY